MTKENDGKSGPVRIDLCAGNPAEGESRPDGWLFHDIDPTIPGLSVVCNLLEIDKYVDSGSCDELRLSHALEHFTKKEVPIVLKKLNKILKIDGVLTIIVPNFRWHATLALEGREEEAVYYCFGGQLDEYDLHKTGFTPTILKTRLQEAGFAIRYIDDNSSITCEALKL